MRCREVRFHLNAYVDGELSERRHRAVESHLGACASCQERLGEIRSVDELLQGTLPVPPLPEGLAARTMAAARRLQESGIPGVPPPVWRPIQWIAELSAPMRLAACATALVAVVAGFSLDGGHGATRNVALSQRNDVYGLEWFAPVPPSSIGSVYMAMADQPYEEKTGQ